MFTIPVASMMALEQPLFKVPAERFRKAARTEQKHIDKETTHIREKTAEASKLYAAGDHAGSAQILLALAQRLERVHQKLKQVREEGELALGKTRARIRHMRRLEEAAKTPGGKPELSDAWRQWSKEEVDRIIVDFLLREDRADIALPLASRAGIEDLVDGDLFRASLTVTESLQRHDCAYALQWCQENKTALRKIQHPLEFNLRAQECVELLRKDERKVAITHMHTHLVPLAGEEPSRLAHLARVSTLLAISTATTCARYQEMYADTQWARLQDLFLEAHALLHSLPRRPVLLPTLQAGLSALRTVSCGVDALNPRSSRCPACIPPTRTLALAVPRGHHVNSTILCRVSGRRMGDEEAGMAPNGRVYAWRVFEESAARNGGVFVCPQTEATCRLDEVKRVFIL